MTTASTPATLNDMRSTARKLLNEFDAADGLATYYTLYHDPNRTQIWLHHTDGEADGFLVRCQTGMDLFRPIVTLRVRGQAPVEPLLRAALEPNRPYIIVFPNNMAKRIDPFVKLHGMATNLLMRFDPSLFQPEVSVLVEPTTSPDGHPRMEIKRGDEVVAAAGVNWASPEFAEVFVTVQDEDRMRGLGRTVLNALVEALLKKRVTPLYVVNHTNMASRKLAAKVGFVDTGAREISAQATIIPPTRRVIGQ